MTRGRVSRRILVNIVTAVIAIVVAVTAPLVVEGRERQRDTKDTKDRGRGPEGRRHRGGTKDEETGEPAGKRAVRAREAARSAQRRPRSPTWLRRGWVVGSKEVAVSRTEDTALRDETEPPATPP